MKMLVYSILVLSLIAIRATATEPPSSPDSAIPSFTVIGAVNLPGTQNISPGQIRTVYESIIRAHGFSSDADSSRVRLIQSSSNGQQKVRIIDVGAMTNTLDFKNDTYVNPGDIIEVPQKE